MLRQGLCKDQVKRKAVGQDQNHRHRQKTVRDMGVNRMSGDGWAECDMNNFSAAYANPPKSIPVATRAFTRLQRGVGAHDGVAFAGLFCGFVFFATSQFSFRLGIQPVLLLIIYGICVAYVVTRPNLLRPIWPILVLPVAALILSVWSVDPALSAYRSFQLIMTTLMGVVIAYLLPPYRAMILICLCEMAITSLSILNSVVTFLPPAYDRGEFIGVMTHKNHLAHAVIFSGAGALTLAFYWRVPLLGFALTAALFPVLASTESAGGKVLYALLLVLVSLFWLRRCPQTIRNRVVIGASLVALCLIAGLMNVLSDLIPRMLDTLGKDSTLTGRTILWKFGVEHFWNRPLTGYGFQAFWSEPSYTREYLRAYVDPRTSIFHNGYIEIIVALGVIGGGLGILIFFGCVYRTILWYVRDATITSSYFAFCMLFMMIASFVEPLLFGVHSFNHILVVLAFCYAVCGRTGAGCAHPVLQPNASTERSLI